MKFVALISGGKDSIFNILQCVLNGHELISLANLYPPDHQDSDGDELDSFMFQTVGSDLIPAIAECLDKPLYRRPLNRPSLQLNSYYLTHDPNDEVQDLLQLLQEVVDQHPDIQGISVGAILSNYQRVRVEFVANKLGLTVLAYTWRWDQQKLLDAMEIANMQSILIKVAGMGLNQMHIGRNVCDIKEELRRLSENYGVHPAGEGGEFESLTLDCPLFKKPIVIDDFKLVCHADDDFAPVYYAKIQSFHLEDKAPGNDDLNSMNDLRGFTQEQLTHFDSNTKIIPTERVKQDYGSSNLISTAPESQVKLLSSGLLRGTMFCAPVTNVIPVEEEATIILEMIKKALNEAQMTFQDVLMTHVHLLDMADFTAVNQVYSKYYGTNHPSARACVAIPRFSQSPNRVFFDFIASKQTDWNRMHVQSISYWAPANIGPYSQCVECETDTLSKYYVAGQIGLIPQSMLLAKTFHLQNKLAIQHAASILEAMNHSSLATIGASTDGLNLDCSQAECSDRLVADASRKSTVIGAVCFVSNESFMEEARSYWFNDVFVNGWRPPTLYVEIEGLPKNASVEWELLGLNVAKTREKLQKTRPPFHDPNEEWDHETFWTNEDWSDQLVREINRFDSENCSIVMSWTRFQLATPKFCSVQTDCSLFILVQCEKMNIHKAFTNLDITHFEIATDIHCYFDVHMISLFDIQTGLSDKINHLTVNFCPALAIKDNSGLRGIIAFRLYF